MRKERREEGVCKVDVRLLLTQREGGRRNVFPEVLGFPNLPMQMLFMACGSICVYVCEES